MEETAQDNTLLIFIPVEFDLVLDLISDRLVLLRDLGAFWVGCACAGIFFLHHRYQSDAEAERMSDHDEAGGVRNDHKYVTLFHCHCVLIVDRLRAK